MLPRYNPFITFACLIAVFHSTNFIIPKDVLAYLSRAKELLRSLCQAKLSYYQTAQQRCLDESLANHVIVANTSDARSRSNPATPRDEESTPSRPAPFSLRQGLRSLFTPIRGVWPRDHALTHSASASHVLASHARHLSFSALQSSHSLHNLQASQGSQGLQGSQGSQGSQGLQGLQGSQRLEVQSTSPLPHVRSNTQLPSEGRERTPSHFHLQVEGALFNISRAVALMALQFAVALQSDHKDVGTVGEFHRRS